MSQNHYFVLRKIEAVRAIALNNNLDDTQRCRLQMILDWPVEYSELPFMLEWALRDATVDVEDSEDEDIMDDSDDDSDSDDETVQP